MTPFEVRWLDSWLHREGWRPWQEAIKPGPAEIVSVGYLIDDDEEQIVLAQNWCDSSKKWANMVTIPRGCVVSIRPLVVESAE